jgi:general secretion pathway protein D
MGGQRGGVGGVGGVGGARGAAQTGGAATTGGVLGVSLPGGPQAQAGGGGAFGGNALGGGAAGALGAPGPPPIFKQEVRIVADEVTNSLVVLATKRDYQLILDVLKRIDVVPRQVVLEVMIAEVVLGKGLEFGVSYAFSDGSLKNAIAPDSQPTTGDNQNNNGNTGGANVNPTPATQLFDVLEPVTGLIGTAQRVPNQGAFAVFKSGNDFQMFLNALQARTTVKMLAAPHVIAADNREAYILVGQSIPILTSSSQSTVGVSNIVNSVQYRDTGKILSVLPQVNSKGLVNLQIRQEVSAILQTTSGAVTSFGSTGSPAFSTREIDTTLVVQNGSTVLLGGIIDDSISHTRSGVPYLMDLPVLGWAFRSERDTNDRTELLLTITPYVIRSREEAETVTADFSERIQGLRELQNAMRRRQHIRPTSAGRIEEQNEEGIPMEERH